MKYYKGFPFKNKEFDGLSEIDKFKLSIHFNSLEELAFVLISREFNFDKVIINSQKILFHFNSNNIVEFELGVFIDNKHVYLSKLICVIELLQLLYGVDVENIVELLLKETIVFEEVVVYRDFYSCGTVKESRRSIKGGQVSYIMFDELNGLYKLGVSNNPKYRERTLQSDKPSVVLIHTFNGNYEKQMHRTYNDKRVRGEWFKLSSADVEYLKKNYA